jgi:hypothetical protein
MSELTLQALAVGVRKLQKRVLTGEQMVLERLENLDKLLVGREPTEAERLIACAAKIVPFKYNMDIVLTGAAPARTPGTVTITQEGYFLLDRISITYRVTDGQTHVGRFRPISSGNPIIAGAELQAGGNVVNKLDFLFELVEGAAQRGRQDFPIPGDVFYRNDNDGYCLGHPDVFIPASVITAYITPLAAMTDNGIATVVLDGRQLLNVVEAGA